MDQGENRVKKTYILCSKCKSKINLNEFEMSVEPFIHKFRECLEINIDFSCYECGTIYNYNEDKLGDLI